MSRPEKFSLQMQALKGYEGMFEGLGYRYLPKGVCIVIMIAMTVLFGRGFAQWNSQGLIESSCVEPSDGIYKTI